VVKKFSVNGSDEPLNKGMRAGRIGNAFDLIDIQDAKNDRPSMVSEQGIMVRAEIFGACVVEMAVLDIRHSAIPSTSPAFTPKPTMRRVNWFITTSTQWAWSKMDSQ
jgi:hypothetical protein